MKKIILLLFIIHVTVLSSQNSWKKINSQSKLTSSKLSEVDFYSIDITSFKENISSQKKITLPDFYGNFSDYYITETSNFTEEVSNKYSSIKSYSLKGIEDKTATGKLSIGTDGVHIMMFSGKHKTLYINPYNKDKTTYAAHLKGALDDDSSNFTCFVEDKIALDKNSTDTYSHKNANDSKLRIYRLALACTGEYAQFHIIQQGLSDAATDSAKEEAVLSAMNTSITRVNAVFEKDLAVRLNIVLNSNGNNDLIFLDADTDNLTNDNPFSLINESQVICDDIVGSSNYDIGHTFSTGAGGLAGLGVICSTNSKGQGVTGTQSPIGDTFDIDYVAHEIGHQFGAPHTFNGENGINCDSNNRSDANAVEPGSGTTIMSYVGICSPINVQNNSDDYFHAFSIASMWAEIQSTSCATEVDTNNSSPIINLNNTVYNVPISTPLILKGDASDTDSSNLTYCWEQIDTELVTVPLSTNIAGPAFRSLPPSDSSDRYLPTLATVVAGSTANDWEVIPEVPRDMNFSLTVRDNEADGGATDRQDISITFIDTDPFTVNTPDNLTANTNQAITWNVGDTNTSPINADKVTIKLSIDGGDSFPFTIIENTDNDGTENVFIPSGTNTNNAILLIEASDNIFYNISGQFDILNSGEISLSNLTGDITVCSNDEITYQLNYAPAIGFTETVSFDITNTPSNASITIAPNSLDKSGIIIVTVSNLTNVSNDDYSLTLTASSTSINQNVSLDFQKISDYCKSIGNASDQTSINLVDFANISNTSISTTTGYSDFKDIIGTLNVGESDNLIVNIDTDGNFQTNTKAWIDWNQNCVLEESEGYDLGETTNVANEPTTNSPLTITVPEDAQSGSTVMRVTVIYSDNINGTFSSCEDSFYGETEDYTIIINDPTASVEDATFNSFNLYPNPSNGTFNLNFDIFSESNKTVIQLIDIRGRIINKKEYNTTSTVFSEQLNFGDLNAGLYLLQITNGSKQTMKKIIIE